MSIDMGLPENARSPDGPAWRRLLSRPSTRLGLLAVALAATHLVLLIINSTVFIPAGTNEPAWRSALLPFLPFYGISMLLCGLAGAVAGFFAILRKQERSWLVWLTLLPGLFVIVLILGEFLVPH